MARWSKKGVGKIPKGELNLLRRKYGDVVANLSAEDREWINALHGWFATSLVDVVGGALNEHASNQPDKTWRESYARLIRLLAEIAEVAKGKDPTHLKRLIDALHSFGANRNKDTIGGLKTLVLESRLTEMMKRNPIPGIQRSINARQMDILKSLNGQYREYQEQEYKFLYPEPPHKFTKSALSRACSERGIVTLAKDGRPSCTS
jgi:hypothetical protein